MDALTWLLLPLLTGIGSSVWAWRAGRRGPGLPHQDFSYEPAGSGTIQSACDCNAVPECTSPASARAQ